MAPPPHHTADRRPLATRERPVAKRAAARLARAGVAPNAISAAGMVAGIAAGALFALTDRAPDLARPLWIAGAVLVQLRLLANMLDGMVAIEAGRASPSGELWNEIPDRVSDVATLVGLGYAAGSDPALGWAAAVAAVFTAYVRAACKVAGAPQDFCGPMAKPHRMFVVTLAALYCGAVPLSWQPHVPGFVLALVLAGSLFTALRRLRRGAAALRAG